MCHGYAAALKDLTPMEEFAIARRHPVSSASERSGDLD
jgi:hypothetical protein